MLQTKVAIVGAGLAGLCCARHLLAAGVPCEVFEASDRVGGRVATDRQDGFLLDRGFQVFLDSYPEAQNVLDYEALDLAAFAPGARLQYSGRSTRIVDAWRQPLRALWAARSRVVPLRDIPRMVALRRAALTPGHRLRIPANLATVDYLQQLGFSQTTMQRFFRPFFGGVTLDSTLNVPARYFLFLFEMFARGSATLPAAGMQAIPEQIAASLPKDVVRLQNGVDQVQGSELKLTNGERVSAEHVVIATEAKGAADLLGSAFQAPPSNCSITLYYGADRSELNEPVLMLAGDGRGPVNHVCFPSDVHPTYAPSGAALASVSVMGHDELDDQELDRAVRSQLRPWMSEAVARWQLLRIDRIARSLPHIAHADGHGVLAVKPNVTVCGDHLLTPSIQGAMVAGRHAADLAKRCLE